MRTARGGVKVVGVVLMAAMGACHSSHAHGDTPTPAVGTIAPAVLSPSLAADGQTLITITDSYQGTTYGGATGAFVLTATVTVDGVVVPSVPLQYLITAGSLGSGTFMTAVSITVGVLPAGNHTIAISVQSPPDFHGTNHSASQVQFAAG